MRKGRHGIFGTSRRSAQEGVDWRNCKPGTIFGKCPTLSERAISGCSESPEALIVSAPIEGAQVAVGSNISQSIQHDHHYSSSADGLSPRNSEPTPNQIRAELDKVLPFDRENARKTYNGLAMLWRLQLRSISRTDYWGMLPEEWLVQTDYAPESESEHKFANVSFRVSSVPGHLKAAPQ